MDAQEPRPKRLVRIDAFLERSGRRLLDSARRALTSARARVRELAAQPRVRRVARIAGRDALAAFALTFVAIGLGRLCFERIDPGTVGVLQRNWGAEREITPRDYAPGVHFAPRFLYSWQRLDARTRVLSFARPRNDGSSPPIEVRTPTGPTAQIEVRVPYRILPGEAHLVVGDGLKSAYPLRVESTVEKVLVEELSKLETEALCDPDLRQAAADGALARLNVELASLHVGAEGVFVEAVFFSPDLEREKQDQQLKSQAQATNEVLDARGLERLKGESIAVAVEQAKTAEVARASRTYAEEKELWEKRRIADQKIVIQLLEVELAREKQAKLDELERGFEETKRLERDGVLEELALAHESAKLRVAQAARELEDELARAAEVERGAAEGAIEALRSEGALAAQGLERAEQAESARLELELARARVAGDAALRALQRASELRAATRRREGDAAYERMVAEGEVALAAAEARREELEAAALATPGARMLLARDAATNLNLARVALDSNDPRVPSVLDLDALVALLIGAAGE